MIDKDLERRIKSLEKKINTISPDICVKFPIPDYINDVKSHRDIGARAHFGIKRKKIFKKIKDLHGAELLALYHKLALAGLIKDSKKRLKTEPLPVGIICELQAWFQRVIKDFARQPDSYYELSNIDFMCDVGVCSLKCLPIGGAWFVQVRRIGFLLFLTTDIRRVLRILIFLIFRTKGFKPFCNIHTVPRYLLRFNCQRMNLAYQLIGELIKRNPMIKGIYRRSWFLDPNLDKISPNLNYLREIPQKNGAVLFKALTRKLDIRLALAFSPQRRRLYEDGKYLPVAHAYIWPRKEFLGWLGQKEKICS